MKYALLKLFKNTVACTICDYIYRNSLFFKFKSNLLAKRVFFLVNVAIVMAILDLISRVHLALFVTLLAK